LKETLDELQKTQTHLVESEKMAALGQLVAGIAHEINSPLGAIRSSIESIMQDLQQMLVELPDFLHQLPDERRSDFFALLEQAQQRDLSFSPKEERKYRRALTRVLGEHDVDNARKVADTLVDMGIYTDVEPFLPLLLSRHHAPILEMAYRVSGLQESTHTIMMAANRASKVVFALRTYARYDYSGELVDANIIDGIDTILTLYHNQMKHGVHIVRQYGDIEPIRCYPDELSQVWTNLVHNALQAMEYTGTLTIVVHQNENRILVDITDSGKGVPEEIQEKIFDPFFTTKPSGEGSGLGLDIVKRIIEKHQGAITFSSEPGRTTFSVSLPIIPAD
jgi:signal transduction histidine kinase